MSRCVDLFVRDVARLVMRHHFAVTLHFRRNKKIYIETFYKSIVKLIIRRRRNNSLTTRSQFYNKCYWNGKRILVCSECASGAFEVYPQLT